MKKEARRKVAANAAFAGLILLVLAALVVVVVLVAKNKKNLQPLQIANAPLPKTFDGFVQGVLSVDNSVPVFVAHPEVDVPSPAPVATPCIVSGVDYCTGEWHIRGNVRATAAEMDGYCYPNTDANQKMSISQYTAQEDEHPPVVFTFEENPVGYLRIKTNARTVPAAWVNDYEAGTVTFYGGPVYIYTLAGAYSSTLEQYDRFQIVDTPGVGLSLFAHNEAGDAPLGAITRLNDIRGVPSATLGGYTTAERGLNIVPAVY